MANPDERSPADPPARPSRGFRALLRRLRHGRAQGEDDAEPQEAGAGGDLISQARAFQSLTVEDVMTPRADIVAVDLDSAFGEVVARFAEAEHSRMPIFRETLDDPVGVVHVKDVFRLLAAETGRPKDDEHILQRLRRDALYVPGSMRAADLLVRMQAQRIHMALVIDEFGGTDGLVTLEDLVEGVVGDIDDEHDEQEEAAIIARPSGVFEADARAPLEDLEAAVGAPLVPADFEEEIDTVAGLVTALAGRVPQRGELIAHPSGFELQVLDADPRRVKRVRLRPAAPGAGG
ncbi:hemolysin family protein [Phenylobacterium sp.]|uniref:hemolysin family protein n=1 Tax=Phenylobacterium sp. TaxID=1871053 RepID=UPI0035B162FA